MAARTSRREGPCRFALIMKCSVREWRVVRNWESAIKNGCLDVDGLTASCPARSPPVADRARGFARNAALTCDAGVVLRTRTAAALGPAGRPCGARGRWRDLDRRDQILDRRFPHRPEMGRIPDALRSSVLRDRRARAPRYLSGKCRPHS